MNVAIRRLTNADAQDLTSQANNKKLSDNLRDYFPHPYSMDDAHSFIAMTAKEDPEITFAMTYKSQFAGIIGVIPQSDVYRQTGEIGYWLGEEFWGKGITTQAIKLIVVHAFENLKLIRIHCGVFGYNIGSQRVLEKNGFKKEGVFQQSITKNGEVSDEHRYALLKTDYNSISAPQMLII